VAYALLEPSGQLSVLKKPEYQTVTRQDMGIEAGPDGMNVELIYSGAVVEQNLRQAGVSRQWLDNQLRMRGLSDPTEVFLATIDSKGALYVDCYQDHLQQLTDVDDQPSGGGDA
jgi:uncharacterized membrane protein YcaP (DUF421 family)